MLKTGKITILLAVCITVLTACEKNIKVKSAPTSIADVQAKLHAINSYKMDINFIQEADGMKVKSKAIIAYKKPNIFNFNGKSKVSFPNGKESLIEVVSNIKNNIQTSKIITDSIEKNFKSELNSNSTNQFLTLQLGIEGFGLEMGTEYLGTVNKIIEMYDLKAINNNSKLLYFEGSIKKSVIANQFKIVDAKKINLIAKGFPSLRVYINKESLVNKIEHINTNSPQSKYVVSFTNIKINE